MITRITGVINRVLDDELRMQLGPIEYQILVPECVRRQVQTLTGTESTLFTQQYFEGNPTGSRFIPRLVGFLQEAELEFFELFCTVEKIGVRKALKALARPVKEIADAIQREDKKWLTTLPGIGGTTAEQIVASLRKKVLKFALAPDAAEAAPVAAGNGSQVLAEAYQALLSVGHSPADARDLLDKATVGKKFTDVGEVLQAIYQRR